VVLALAIFFSASLVLLSAVNMALRTGRRVRLEAQAADLAVSLLSEIQMGQLAPADDGPNEYQDEGLVGWTWEIVTEPVEQAALLTLDVPQFLRVEVIVRYQPERYTYRIVELMTNEPAAVEGEGQAQPQDGPAL
jgi:hypothetical protein